MCRPNAMTHKKETNGAHDATAGGGAAEREARRAARRARDYGDVNKQPLLMVSPSDADGGRMIGRDPRDLTPDDFEQAGVLLRPVMEAIRAKCLDCCGNLPGEVRKCPAVDCPLWALRMKVFPSALRRAANGS
jgi:hypothetical protein